MAEILEWKLREDAHRYLSRQNPPYFDTVKLCNAFASGDQWRGIDTGGMPTPVFNIISRAIQHFVASVTSTDVAIQLSALPFAHVPNTEDGVSAVQISQSEIANILEKWNFSDRLREASSMALSTGDVAIHIWFDASKKPYGGTVEGMSGEICMELVPGSSVLFSNPNNDDVDVQSWVALEGREPVEALKAEAKRWRSNEGEVLSDNDFAGADSDAAEIEMEGDAYGKANFLLVYRKDPETGEITATKFTKDAYIYKDIKTDLHIIPVRWLQWERQPGQYHGKSLTYSVIPNQIVINRMVAMVVYHLMMTAFPAMVYNAEMMEKPSNEVGMAIGVHGLAPGISLNSAATYLEPGQMSSQIIQALNLVWSWTKEALGMSDAAAGLVNPETASGAAIVATAKQASIPLQNFQSSMYTWIEGIGRVLLDVMGTYYGSRPVVMNDQEEPRAVTFDFTAIKNLWMAVRADVGATSYWSEVLQQQTLDNLLKAEKISFIDYLERVSDITIPRKQELIQKLRAEAEATQAQQAAPPTAPTAPAASAQPTADYEAMAVFMEGLPQELQTKLMQLSKQDPQAFEQTVKEMMTQQ